MALTAADFPRFFQELNGHEPFAWQQRAVDYILENGSWPERIAAPTGTGKSSVIDIHAFVNALAQQDELKLPRRLIMTVNRRSLIDDHAEHAARVDNELAHALSDAARPTLQVAAQLLQARSGLPDPEPGTVLPVHTIRGGQALAHDWRTMPTVPAVLCITPDMWGSRALFRGYGTARNARPLEAGLLTRDCVLVIDEAHLNRQLIVTARRLAQLDRLAPADLGIPHLQVVETSATPAGNDPGTSIRIDEADLKGGSSGAILTARLKTPKPVTLRPIDLQRSREKELATVFTDACLELAASFAAEDAPVGCIVNTASLAHAVAQELRSRTDSSAQGEILEIVGAQRPFDTARLRAVHHELFSLPSPPGAPAGPAPKVGFVVSTQALEVGVNLDFSALVTELAPAPALIQRSGRLNRFGRRADARILVLAPAYNEKNMLVPYDKDDLDAAQAWVLMREADPQGFAPWALAHDSPPAETPKRLLLQRPEWPEIVHWSRTSEDLASAETSLPGRVEDLTLWLRDQFTDRVEAFVVVRGYLPADPQQAREIADATKPLGDELFPSSLHRVRKIAELQQGTQPAEKRPLLIYRQAEALLLDDPAELKPGDTLVVSPNLKAFRNAVAHDEGTGTAEDVYDEVFQQEAQKGKRGAYGGDAWQIRRLVSITDDANTGMLTLHASLLHWLDTETATPAEAEDEEQLRLELLEGIINQLTELPAGAREGTGLQSDLSLQNLSLTVIGGASPLDPVFLLVRAARIAVDEALQETAHRDVTLAAHSQAVAQRAQKFTAALRLPAAISAGVHAAAEQHDSGKADARFQAYLTRGRTRKDLLAKSKHPFDRTRHARAGLTGWRHEQLSAAFTWTEPDSGISEQRELITWLTGTSHGHGRGSFPFDAALLLPEASPDTDLYASARELFDDGAWDDLFEPLLRHYGPWGLAYLEAIVRAADQTVSGEGR
jgi:CRISPR-associated endonuclease/helicase Cas3